MISCKPIVLLFVLILFPRSLFAQGHVISTVHHVDMAIPYHPADKSDFHGNAILRELAKDVLREPWQVRIRISCELRLSITKDGDRNRLFISFRDLLVSGDTVYRHFPVTDVLFPSRIGMKLKWANRADTSGFTEQTITGKSMAHSDSLICSIPVGSYDPLVDTLMVRAVEFSYDSLALRTFADRIELIHDYYASVALLDSLQRFTADLHLDNATLLPFNYLKVSELVSVIRQIDARDFPGKLLQNGFDPSGLANKRGTIYKHSRSLVYNFMDEIHRTGVIPMEADADLLAMYFTSRVYSYVRRSFLMDQHQGRIYNDCLDHFFDQGAFPAEEKVESKMLVKMFPDARQDTIAQYISRRIYRSYQRSARRLMDENQYAEAFSMMQNGRRFIAGNPSLQGSSADDLLLSEAAEGIRNSYVGIASTCIRSHKFNMAELYLSKAERYAEEHAKYIRSDSSYRAVFSELFFLRNADCDDLLDQKKYEEAISCYEQFEMAYSPHDLELVSAKLDEKKSLARIGLGNISASLTEKALKRKESDTALFYYEQAVALRQESEVRKNMDNKLDSLAPVMARIKFDQIFRDGSLALEKRQFTLAVARLDEAKSLADKYRFDYGREFDSTYRRAMKNFLIIQLSVTQKRIWANQFDTAQLELQRIQTIGFDNGLSNDSEFSAALENFKVKVQEQRCRNLQDSVDLMVIKADRSIAMHNFRNTIIYLQQALVFARSMPVCANAEKPVLDTIARYLEAADYQQKLADISANVATGNYAEAVHSLEKCQQLYQNHRLDRFGIVMTDTYDFIRERGNPNLTEAAIVFFIDMEKYQESIRYLLLIHDQGIPAKNMVIVQEALGRKLAQLDHLNNSREEAVKMIVKYVPAESWYDAFRATYTKEWNQLNREGAAGSK
ncbi:MAG: hypothetical protein NTW16_05970 [Bacteroidetes bacterium]|nr:hypothetical protein [Bacteroidota bacterium]